MSLSAGLVVGPPHDDKEWGSSQLVFQPTVLISHVVPGIHVPRLVVAPNLGTNRYIQLECGRTYA